MRNPATLKAIVAFIGGIALASPAYADGITHNPDGSMSGFPSYYHAGVYCDAVQFYANGPQYFGVWKDYPAKLTQARFCSSRPSTTCSLPSGRPARCSAARMP